MKRIAGVVFALVIILGMIALPPPANAAVKSYAVTDGQLKFDTASGTVTGYSGSPTRIVIPKTINGVKVKSIAIGAFSSCKSLTAITLPVGLASIGERAFWECEGLAGINIPESVTSIGGWAFTYCSALKKLTVQQKNPAYSSQDSVLYNKTKTELLEYPGGKYGSFTIPRTVKKIAEGAFYSCEKIAGITIPEGVLSIGRQAFYCCKNIGDIHLPDSITSIGIRAFAGCEAEEITVGENSKTFAGIDGVLFNKAKTALVSFPGARGGSYAIPDGVKSVSSNAFANCGHLEEVYIPKSVKRLEDGAFISCSSLVRAYFLGDAPNAGEHVFDYTGEGLEILYPEGNKSFTDSWQGCKTDVFSPDMLLTD